MRLNSISKIIISTVCLTIFTGCTTTSNGIKVTIPNEKNKEIRSKYSLYIDDSAQKRSDNGYLINIVKHMKKGLKLNTHASASYINTSRLYDSKSDSTIADEKFEFFYDFVEPTTRTHLMIDNISLKNLEKVVKGVNIEKTEKFIKYDATIKDGSIIVNKEYLNSSEAFADFINIVAIGDYHYDNVQRRFNRQLMLDANMLKDNKLVIKPVGSKFDFVKVFRKVVKEFGYKLAKNKSDSDFVVDVQIYGVGKENVRRYKNRGETKDSLGRVAMEYSSASGGSSASSALIGLGVFAAEKLLSRGYDPIVDSKVSYQIGVFIKRPNVDDYKKFTGVNLNSVKLDKAQDFVIANKIPRERNYTFRFNSQQIIEYFDYGKFKEYKDTVFSTRLNVYDKLNHKGFLTNPENN